MTALATEAEISVVFRNEQDAIMLRQALEFMGYPQPATPIQMDNECALGILTNFVKQWRFKATNIRFYWLKCRIKQGQFYIYWRRGSYNLVDYFTKHYYLSHHKIMRSTCLINFMYWLQEK